MKIFKKKINIITDINVELKIQNNKLLEKFEKTFEKKYINTITSTDDFEKYLKEKEPTDVDKDKDIDNELLQDCYDNLPRSNIKQTTSYGFFYWK